MELMLLIFALILICCILFSRLTQRWGIPSLLFFIGFGMICGADGLLKIDFSNYVLTEKVATLCLAFVIFYGGFGTNWKVAKKVAPPAILLSTVGVGITALLTGIFCFKVLHLGLTESFLLGAVMSCTDAAAVFSILRSRKLNLKNGSASILELESGSNDPIAYMLTIVLIEAMNQQLSWRQVPLTLLEEVGIGLSFGFLIGGLSVWALQHIKLKGGLKTLFVLAVALLSYTVPLLLGGNGYLSTYLAGLVIGNASISDKGVLVNFFDGLTELAEMALFFLLGLLAYPSQMPSLLLPALAIFIWLTFVARPLMVFGLLAPFRYSTAQKSLLAWSGLRGASSIVFAILVVLRAPDTSYDIFHISFCLCLLSIMIQGGLLPRMAHRLNMVDDKENVLKTFTDYPEEQVALIRTQINENHRFAYQTMDQLALDDLLILSIQRDQQFMIPNGKTQLLPGDQLVVSGASYQGDNEWELHEETITKRHPWVNQALKEISLPANTLIIFIRRADGISLIPKGETKLLMGDTVVIASEQHHAPHE